MKQFAMLLAVAPLVFLQGGTLPGPPASAPEQGSVSLASGSVAPSFDLPDVNGKRLRLDEYRGKAVVLNFWAFWCDTWKAEMPHLRELATRQDDLNFRIVAISVDGTRLPEFAPSASSANRFPVALDVGGQVSGQYGIAHVPTVVILDPQGRVQYSCVAWPGNQTILNRLRALASVQAQTGSQQDAPVTPGPRKVMGRRIAHNRAQIKTGRN